VTCTRSRAKIKYAADPEQASVANHARYLARKKKKRALDSDAEVNGIGD
jgi:hypothetical protein